MEAVTAALDEADFGLDALTSAQVETLTSLLRHVRVAAGDFRDEPAALLPEAQ
jgi:hypothetical protein